MGKIESIHSCTESDMPASFLPPRGYRRCVGLGIEWGRVEWGGMGVEWGRVEWDGGGVG